jgi:hypothetical protein
MKNERGIAKDMDESCCGLNEGTIPALRQTEWGKPHKTSRDSQSPGWDLKPGDFNPWRQRQFLWNIGTCLQVCTASTPNNNTVILTAVRTSNLTSTTKWNIYAQWNARVQKYLSAISNYVFFRNKLSMKTVITKDRHITTWSLCVLIYCQRALMMTGRVWVCTPSNRARRGSNLNWRGW